MVWINIIISTNTSKIVDSVGTDHFLTGYSSSRAARGDVSCALLHSGCDATVLHTISIPIQTAHVISSAFP